MVWSLEGHRFLPGAPLTPAQLALLSTSTTHRVMTLKFIATAANGDDMTAELTAFAASIGLDRVAPGRYSFALVLGLFGGFKSGHQNPAKIMREIEALEGIGPPSQLKTPGSFNHQPLKGLWHTH